MSALLILIVPSLIAAGGALLMRSQLRAPLNDTKPIPEGGFPWEQM